MMYAMCAALAVVAFLLGGLGRRIAGGALNQWAGLPGGVDGRVMGDTPARFIYAGLIAVCAVPGLLLGHGTWFAVPAIVFAVWVGSTTGNFESIAMGRGSHSFWHDWVGMTAHGAICAILVEAALYGLHMVGLSLPEWRSLVGFGFYYAAPAYWLAWCITGRSENKRLPVGLRMGSDLGELIWGGLCGAGVFFAFWLV